MPFSAILFHKFWVTYYGNGNTGGSTAAQTKVCGAGNITISANGFTAPSGKKFKTWNTNASGTGTNYAPGTTYSTNAALNLYAIWEDDAKYLQDFAEKGYCNNIAQGAEKTYRDKRDNNDYTVAKVNFNGTWKCMMTQNLRLTNYTLKSTDSNVTSDFTLGASAKYSGISADVAGVYVENAANGAYYSWYTATAGTSGLDDATKDICPKGWRLPTSAEWQALYGAYNSSALLRGAPVSLVLSGMYDSDGQSVYYVGSNGHFWSSTTMSWSRAYFLNLGSSNVNPADSLDRCFGHSVRCVAK